jgi:uncharacterized membrane protein YfcA
MLASSLIVDHIYIAILLLCIACFVAGYVDSIAGGGGLILLPSFLMAGFLPQNALAQGKLVSSIGTLVAIRNFAKNKTVIWKVIPVGILASLLGAFIGSKIVLSINPDFVYYIILVLMPLGLIMTIYKSRIKNNNTLQDIKHSVLLVALTCFVVGFYDGFFGPGAGSIFIILLYLVNKMPLLNASATAKVLNFGSNIGAFISYALAGKMFFLIGIPMIIACVLGNYIGSNHAIKTNGAIIKKVLVITVSIMFVGLAIKIYNS